MFSFKIPGLKQQKLQLNLLEDIFIQKVNQKKIEFYALTIVFTEELLQQFLQAIVKKLLKVLVQK